MSSDLYHMYLLLLTGKGARVVTCTRNNGFYDVYITCQHQLYHFKLLDNDIFLKDDGNIRYQSLHWCEWDHHV